MRKISWCKCQDRGIRIIESNDNLSREYFSNAEESMKVLRSIWNTQSMMWLATTKYYIEYFAVYSILMKIGVKCEIHDCTISLSDFLEREGILEKGTAALLENDKGLRIDNQYYLKNRPVDVDMGKMSGFLLSIRQSLEKLNPNRIKELRKKIESL
ncbi:MAG: hypothetical protein NT001_01135 [Candidatus Woesearchaeota archaeon]|nr:hypothetical protein [Candidatus Woesearchaeota archaeon]